MAWRLLCLGDMRAWPWILLALGSACRFEIDYDGTEFSCVADERCPPGFACVDEVCRRTSPAACGDGVRTFSQDQVEHGGRCYELHDLELSWVAAAAYCRAYDGQLAALTSAGEQEAVAAVLGEIDDAWIGLQRSADGTLSWVTGEPVRFTAWAPGEPSVAVGATDGDEKTCVALDEPTGLWRVHDCEDRVRPLCERELP